MMMNTFNLIVDQSRFGGKLSRPIRCSQVWYGTRGL
jgi:hypothetical protein